MFLYFGWFIKTLLLSFFDIGKLIFYIDIVNYMSSNPMYLFISSVTKRIDQVKHNPKYLSRYIKLFVKVIQRISCVKWAKITQNTLHKYPKLLVIILYSYYLMNQKSLQSSPRLFVKQPEILVQISHCNCQVTQLTGTSNSN